MSLYLEPRCNTDHGVIVLLFQYRRCLNLVMFCRRHVGIILLFRIRVMIRYFTISDDLYRIENKLPHYWLNKLCTYIFYTVINVYLFKFFM